MRLLLCLVLIIAATSAWPKSSEQPLYLSLPTPPAPELTPQEALDSFTLAPGFKVELIAAEPLVEDPIALTWDTAGNLYAVEMRGFMPDEFGNGEDQPVGAVVRLRDTDGDGFPDLREVMMDQLVLPRAVAVVNEGLLIAEPPNLWLCPGLADDWHSIDCSRKQRLGTYGDQPGSVEHVENGLLLALDNWLYSAKSNRRLRINQGALEIEPTLFRGQWGIAQNDAGRLFYNTNSNLLLGDSYDAQPIVASRISAAPGLGARISRNDQLFAVRVNPGVNRAYVPGVLREDGRLNRPTSASGMTIFRGDQFGEGHGNLVFVSEPAANAVVQLKLRAEGLSLSTEHVLYPHETWQQVEFFASTDERFRPVNVYTGPDGALYVVDMYRGIIQDHMFLSDELRAQAVKRGLEKSVGMGRIWRIRAVDQPLRTAITTPTTADKLIDWLGHPNGWHRDTAQRLLIAHASPNVDPLLSTALQSASAIAAVHILWTLSGRDALGLEAIQLGLANDDPAVRQAALTAGHQHLSDTDLLNLARQETDPVVRHHAIMYLANTASAASNPSVHSFLLSLLDEAATDSYTQIAIQAAVVNHELNFIQQMIATNTWSAQQESSTELLAKLSVQAVRVDPANAVAVLDLAHQQLQTQPQSRRWLAVALLEGVFAVTRDADFSRFTLTQPHPVFSHADQDLWPALSKARRAYTWPGDDLAPNAKPLSPAQENLKQQGQAYYAARCATCHGDDGRGIATMAPPLVDTEWVNGPSERLARITLHGLQGPIEVAGQTWDSVMPGHASVPQFTDDVAAGLLTFLHRSWGHTGRAIAPEFIRRIRQSESPRNRLWTAEELHDIDINTHYAALAGRYGGPGLQLGLDYDGQGLNVQSAIFNGPLRETREDHFVFEPRDLHLEVLWAPDNTVQGLRMVIDSGGIELPRLAP